MLNLAVANKSNTAKMIFPFIIFKFKNNNINYATKSHLKIYYKFNLSIVLESYNK